ncbi:MAG: hypothetical protein U9R37_06855 [Campylobacterota bacterium]|nr:hypothetical protein [Campylobacterota bacterium]
MTHKNNVIFKKAISLVEVMVAIVLLTVVVTATLKLQQNNIFYLDKFKQSSIDNSYITTAISNSDQKRDIDITLSDIVDFKDDDIRRELKNIKINIKDEEGEDIELPENDFLQAIKVKTTTYTLKDGMKKVFYHFEL